MDDKYDFIIELPEDLGIKGVSIHSVGSTKARNEDEAVRNYLFRNLSRKDARIAIVNLREKGIENYVHLVPDIKIEGDSTFQERKDARFYAFASSLCDWGTPSPEEIKRARYLWKKGGLENI